VEKDQINVGGAEVMPGSEGLLWCVDQAQVDYLGASPFELLGDLLSVSF
jgi:hypothetical protein